MVRGYNWRRASKEEGRANQTVVLSIIWLKCVSVTNKQKRKLKNTTLNSIISDDNRKFSVMRGTLLYVFCSCERHSELTEEMHTTSRPIPKEDTSSLTFL